MAQHFSTPTQETQDIHLIDEIEKLRTKLQAESEQHIHCINENKELRRQLNESEYIRKEYKKAIETLERKIELLKNGQLRTLQEYQKLQEEFDDLRRENEFLNAIIEQLKDTHHEHLQCSGQLCANNCVLCTILWICQRKLNVFPCGLQLLLLLFKYKSAEAIRPENHMCHSLIIEIFIKCGIVIQDNPFMYPSENNAKLEMIDQAWNTLMAIEGNHRVVILGRTFSSQQGHVEVCDLESRRFDENGLNVVTIHDPQIDKCHEVNKEDFRNRVINDERLTLFAVNLEKLTQIFEEYDHILHHTVQPNQGFTITSGAIDGVQ